MFNTDIAFNNLAKAIGSKKTQWPFEDTGGFVQERSNTESTGSAKPGIEVPPIVGEVDVEVQVFDGTVTFINGEVVSKPIATVPASSLSDENSATLNELRERLKKADQQQEVELNKAVGTAKAAVASAISA